MSLKSTEFILNYFIYSISLAISYIDRKSPATWQVNYFEQTRAHMVDLIGENGTNDLLKKAIFSLTIGSNDILNYIQPSIPFFGHDDHDKVTPIMFQDFMVSNLTVQLKVQKPLVYNHIYIIAPFYTNNFFFFSFDNFPAQSYSGVF